MRCVIEIEIKKQLHNDSQITLNYSMENLS